MALVMLITFCIFKSLSVMIMKLTQSKYLSSIDDSLFFMIMTVIFQLPFLFLLPPYYRLDPDLEMILYSAVFSVFYMLSYTFLIAAFKHGPASLTNVIQNFFLFVPITYGLLFWDESLKLLQVSGLLLFIAAIILINNSSYSASGQRQKISLKWLFLAALSTVMSGFGAVTSKTYVFDFSDSPKEYLISYSLIIAVTGMLYLSFKLKSGRFKVPRTRRYYMYAFLMGFFVSGMNILFLTSVNSFGSVYFFSLISIGSILGVLLLSRLLLKEVLRRKHYAAIVLSMAAIFLLNI